MFRNTISATLLFLVTNHCSAQTYWLKSFPPSDPKNPPTQLRVAPPNPTDLELYPDHVDVTFITIEGNLLIVNDHICHATLRQPEHPTRFQFDNWEEVENIDEYAKFRANIITNLKSDPDNWTKSMWMKEIKSEKPNYSSECGLFSGTRKIYFGKDDVIIPQPFHGYYRYVKGAAAVFHTKLEESK